MCMNCSIRILLKRSKSTEVKCISSSSTLQCYMLNYKAICANLLHKMCFILCIIYFENDAPPPLYVKRFRSHIYEIFVLF